MTVLTIPTIATAALILLVSAATSFERQTGDSSRAVALVAAIQRADYEGDRAALAARHRELTAHRSSDARTAARLRYWRGFALWRRAINGFNETPTPGDLAGDLQAAIAEFEAALEHDRAFVDAQAGVVSCVGYLAFLARGDAARIQTLLARHRPIAEAIADRAADHPRVAWVLGPSRWYRASQLEGAEREAEQAAVIESYERALAIADATPMPAGSSLDPSWGGPELLMNLAWSHLNSATPDPHTAEKYARLALARVPDWHYVRDILLPQILKATRGGQHDQE